ncbi:ferrichrome ABC transporter permease protein [Mycoplasma haemocanis str. Illinois]|uniref:Ferrichrome ABC transporter permease protein n=1 Tax=Mycoplasma haemocanis (strain Illinois) TaxID=1111676 RepID=H6N7Y2_MYCHN|nr:iron chelate uptake ABC transporter family permease subunit [Mycoplasma haemocanis]AEW45754.2 ferrichrome ABC transporter permease protein [Mycoplasma haemocanis str. Illinois]
MQLISFNEPSEEKKSSFIDYLLIGLCITLLFCSLIWLNVFFINKYSITPRELLTVLFFNYRRFDKQEEVVNITSVPPVQRAIWICGASIVAAIAFVLCGSAVQSLTQNPLADATTLGFIEATIFGIICMKGLMGEIIDSSYYHIAYFLFALLGGLITLLLISHLFKKPHHRNQNLQIIFIGLVMNMLFKTITYLIKTSNANSVNTAYALALGGAENIYGLYTRQFDVLKWLSIAIIILFLLSVLCSNKFNLFELGEEQAKTFGINVKLFKYFGCTLSLLSATIAIVLVGNVAFLGLISTHIVRSIFQTRKYQIIIPAASTLSGVLILLGVFLNSLVPYISSSMFILWLGGLTLLSLTLRNKEL